jgi:hypothetical protein
LVFVVGMTSWGYHSAVPVLVALAAGAVMAVLAVATRRRD